MTTHPITKPLRIGSPPRMSRRQRIGRIAAWLFDRIVACALITIVLLYAPVSVATSFMPIVFLAALVVAPQHKRPARAVEHGAPRRMSTLLRRRLAGARAGAAVTSSPHE